MKALRVCGWAVIFTVTLLLAACASQSPKVAQTDMTSGPDATMIQPTDYEDSPILITQDWLDERERAVTARELALERRENALAINQAWLNERETRLAQQTPDLTKREDMLAFRQTFSDEGVELASDMRGDGEFASQGAEPGAYAFAVEQGRCYASVYIPAQYRTVAVTKPIEVPKGENLPRLYQTVTEQVKISDEEMRWEEVLCQDKVTDCRVTEIQRSLFRGGYNPGPIDGILGRQTMAAINAFQKDFNLTVTDHLTVETVSALDAQF